MLVCWSGSEELAVLKLSWPEAAHLRKEPENLSSSGTCPLLMHTPVHFSWAGA